MLQPCQYLEDSGMILSFKDFTNPNPDNSRQLYSNRTFVDDDTKLVKEAIELLRLQKNEIIQKRKRIDNIRFWTFHFIIPFIVMSIIIFNSFTQTQTHGVDSIEGQYFFTLIYSTMISGLILLGSFIFYAERDKHYYDLETDKTTSLLNDINYKIDFLEKSL